MSANQCRTEYCPLGVELLDRYYKAFLGWGKVKTLIIESQNLKVKSRTAFQDFHALRIHSPFSLAVRCVPEVLVGPTHAPGTVGGLSWRGMELLGK